MSSVKPLVLQAKAFVKMIDWMAQFANYTTTMQANWVEAMGIMFCKETIDKYIIADAAGITSGNLVYVETSPQQIADIVQIEENLKQEDQSIFAGGWFHSHPGHNLFYSGTDTANQAYWQNSNPNGVGLVFDLTQVSETFIGFKFFRLDAPNSQAYHEVTYELHGFTEDTLLEALKPVGIALKTIHRLALHLGLKAKEGIVEFDKIEIPETDNPIGTAYAAIEEARKAYYRGSIGKALTNYRISNVLLKNANDPDDIELYVKTTLKLIELCVLNDYPDTAQALVREIIVFVKKMNMKPQKYVGKVEILLGYLADYNHKPEDALFHYKKALTLFEEVEYYQGLYKASDLAGSASWSFLNKNDAIQYFKDALDFASKAQRTSKKSKKIWDLKKKGLSAKIESADDTLRQVGIEKV